MASCVVALGCPADKVQVHHLGVALNDLPFRPREYLPTKPLRVLIAGSFREKKGIPYAIEALARLAGQTELEVTIIGDSDGSAASEKEKRKILQAIENCGLTDKTKMLGYQSHATLISEALDHHIFLSPSVTAQNGDTEGGAPVSIIEMAATGMPVVATRHCDIPEIVHDGVTGFLADERDTEGLVKCLERLVGQPDSWGELAQNARRHIEQSFDARLQGEQLGELYQSIVAA
jgi:colanic acid/amylovoran biosynthesis glycosyltransferase